MASQSLDSSSFEASRSLPQTTTTSYARLRLYDGTREAIVIIAALIVGSALIRAFVKRCLYADFDPVHRIWKPFAILTSALHELGHTFGAWGCCVKVSSITVQSNEGAETIWHSKKSSSDIFILLMGHLGLSFIGSVVIFCGFNTTASAVGSAFLAICFGLVAWLGRTKTRHQYPCVFNLIVAAGILFGVLSIVIGALIASHQPSAASGVRFIIVR